MFGKAWSGKSRNDRFADVVRILKTLMFHIQLGVGGNYAALTYISQFRTGDTTPDGRVRMLWEVVTGTFLGRQVKVRTIRYTATTCKTATYPSV